VVTVAYVSTVCVPTVRHTGGPVVVVVARLIGVVRHVIV
jgi:hypothetical protein